jgi:hypothetical protein
MKHKGFYIVGGSLIVVGAILYFTRNKSNIKKDDTQFVNGGISVTIPPLEAPSSSTPPLIEDIEDAWLTLKGLIIKKQ